MKRKRTVRGSLLDADFEYVEDDGDTGTGDDLCEACGCRRGQHPDEGECTCGKCDGFEKPKG